MAKALVVYATITGNNEDVADIITEALENQGVEVEETEMTMADAADLKTSTSASSAHTLMTKVPCPMKAWTFSMT